MVAVNYGQGEGQGCGEAVLARSRPRHGRGDHGRTSSSARSPLPKQQRGEALVEEVLDRKSVV